MLLAVCILSDTGLLVMDTLGKFGEHSKLELVSTTPPEQLLRFSCALQTSHVYPLLDIQTLGMNQFLSFQVQNLLFSLSESS